MSPIQQIRHPRDSIRGEWIDELDAAQALAVLHILAEDRGAAGVAQIIASRKDSPCSWAASIASIRAVS